MAAARPYPCNLVSARLAGRFACFHVRAGRWARHPREGPDADSKSATSQIRGGIPNSTDRPHQMAIESSRVWIRTGMLGMYFATRSATLTFRRRGREGNSPPAAPHSIWQFPANWGNSPANPHQRKAGMVSTGGPTTKRKPHGATRDSRFFPPSLLGSGAEFPASRDDFPIDLFAKN